MGALKTFNKRQQAQYRQGFRYGSLTSVARERIDGWPPSPFDVDISVEDTKEIDGWPPSPFDADISVEDTKEITYNLYCHRHFFD